MHDPDTQQCQNCACWRPMTQNGNDPLSPQVALGQCRLNPPSTLVLPGPYYHGVIKTKSNYAHWMWPWTEAEDDCHQWRGRKPYKLPPCTNCGKEAVDQFGGLCAACDEADFQAQLHPEQGQ